MQRYFWLSQGKEICICKCLLDAFSMVYPELLLALGWPLHHPSSRKSSPVMGDVG